MKQMYRKVLEGITVKGGYEKGKVEKQFQSEILKKLSKFGWTCFHPQDVGLADKFLDSINITPSGDTVYIEFKKIETYTYNLNQYRPGQYILLNKFESMPNVEAYTLIYSVRKNEFVVRTMSELKEETKLFSK